MARPDESDKMSTKTLQEQVREAFATTGPAALEVVVMAMADRITALEGVLEKATAPTPAPTAE